MKKDIKVEIFNREFRAYERWFKREKRVYYMELKALKRVLRGIKFNKALEVGVGSGRFASFLNIKYGIEPSRKMRYIASKRGIKVIFAKAQKIPFKNNSFDLVLMVTTICFLDNPLVALKEIKRVLRKDAMLIIAFAPKSFVLKNMKKDSKFYKYASLFNTKEIISLLRRAHFKNIEVKRAIFGSTLKDASFYKNKKEELFIIIKAKA